MLCIRHLIILGKSIQDFSNGFLIADSFTRDFNGAPTSTIMTASSAVAIQLNTCRDINYNTTIIIMEL